MGELLLEVRGRERGREREREEEGGRERGERGRERERTRRRDREREKERTIGLCKREMPYTIVKLFAISILHSFQIDFHYFLIHVYS